MNKTGDTMELKRNKILNITTYIISITFYMFIFFIFYKFLLDLHFYYLFITIPVLFLLLSLTISNIIKMFLTIISMVFGRNGNEETIIFIAKAIDFINRITKYTLIGIFTTLLSSIMILDIIMCVNDGNYSLLIISSIIWIVLFYSILKVIVKMIKKEIRL